MDFFGIFANDNSIEESVERQFSTSSQYFLFFYKQQKFQAGFKNWDKWIDNQALREYLEHLPPWDPTSRDTVKTYIENFQDGGTHMILGSVNGARFFLVKFPIRLICAPLTSVLIESLCFHLEDRSQCEFSTGRQRRVQLCWICRCGYHIQNKRSIQRIHESQAHNS